MIKMKHFASVFLIVLGLIVFGMGSAFGETDEEKCKALAGYVSGLTDEALNMPVTNVTAAWKPAAGANRAYCEVQGRIFPQTDFAVRLPIPWNGKLIHHGGGGWDGSVPRADTTSQNMGYVGSMSNGGHSGAIYPGGDFGLEDPYYRQYFPGKNQDNPYACQMIIDFGNRALRETPVLAKKIIRQFYGSDAQRTYYNGRSTGGREGLVEAQMNYDLFDGYFIGSPVGGQGGVSTRGLWDTVQGEVFTSTPGFPPAKRDLFDTSKATELYKAVYGKCDGLDGVVDGMIDDPLKCEFDPLAELPACEDSATAGCFTLAQRKALKEIYSGPHNSKGQPLYVGTPYGAEYMTSRGSGFGDALIDDRGPDVFRFWNVYDVPPGPAWDGRTFNWNRDTKLYKNSTCTQCYGSNCETYSITKEVDAVQVSPTVAPNMGGFAPVKQKGAKIVHYDGWADSLVSPLTSVKLYETVMKQMGTTATKSFWKMYMIPGMGHGLGSGISAAMTWEDGFNAMVNWVENGIEPGAFTGKRAANVDVNWPGPERTRPICPYPEVARWNGSGNIDDAASFRCAPPIEVRIEPEVLNLKRKGLFTALITIPHDYYMRDWNLNDITCEGASATFGFPFGNKYIVMFRIQDVQNVTPGNSVTLTVKGKFQKDGKDALVQASDTIRVIN